jgi:hypothetical protein
MSRKILVSFKVLYLVATSGTILWSEIWVHKYGPEGGIIPGLALFAIAFPSSIIVNAIIALPVIFLEEYFKLPDVVIDKLGFVILYSVIVLGYIQWFWFIPKMIEKIRGKGKLFK